MKKTYARTGQTGFRGPDKGPSVKGSLYTLPLGRGTG